MSEITESLRRLGFAEYEAKAYVTLLQRSPLSGYGLAKLSGVPRADIYAVLQKLEVRGAVLRLDLEAGTRYSSVPPTDVIERLEAHYQENAAAARRSLEQVSAPLEPEYIWNARGYPVLIEHARALLNGASQQLLIALSFLEARILERDLARAKSRDVEITTLCLDACPGECGCCHGNINRYKVGPRDASRWLVVVSDHRELLAGEVGGEEEGVCVRTRNRLLVGLAGRYILHSVGLARVVEDLGDRKVHLLHPKTLGILASLDFEMGALLGRNTEEPPELQQTA